METKNIMLRYGIHYEAIKRIGSYPLSKELQLSDLGSTKKDLKTMKSISQRCYIDMRKDRLDVSVIDYICWVSTSYVLDRARSNLEQKTPDKYNDYIIRNYDSFREEANNLLRLFIKKPEFYFNWIHQDNENNGINTKSTFGVNSKDSILYYDDLRSFKNLAGFWFILRQKELMSEHDGWLFLNNYMTFGITEDK